VARRRRSDALAVSLFPFLSVLACVIGTLTLLLAALAIGSVTGPSLEAVEMAERFQALQRSLVDDREALEELLEQLSEVEARHRIKETLRARLTGLGLASDIDLEDLDRIVRLTEEQKKLQARRKNLERQDKRQVASIAKAEATLKGREADRVGSPILIDPSGFGREQRPWLVECTSDHLKLHRPQADWTHRIPENEILADAEFKRFLLRIRAIRNGLVIFLIRPDGVSTYDLAARAADRQGVRHAKLPLPGEGRLDLKRFSDHVMNGGEGS